MNNYKDSDQSLIEDLGLSERLIFRLHRMGILTIGLLEEFFEDSGLENLSFMNQKRKNEVSNALKRYKSESPIYNTKHILDDAETFSQDSNKTKTWSRISQSYFEFESDKYTYILLSRMLIKPKKLRELASRFHVTCERVGQIQEETTLRFLKHVNFAGSNQLIKRILEILSRYGDDLSLEMFRGKLMEEGLLGSYSQDFISKRDFLIDPLEILISWLKLLSDVRYPHPPIILPVDLDILVASNTVSIKDYKNFQKIKPMLRRLIMEVVYRIGAINIEEASTILSTDKHTTASFLRYLNLKEFEGNWYSL